MSQNASLPRVFDYWLGGSQHTPVDAELGERLSAELPVLAARVRAQRSFQREALAEGGLDQFFVLEAGFPTGGHVHEQLPSAKVFYSDPDFNVVQPGAGLLAGIRKRVLYRSVNPLNPDDLDGIAPRELDMLDDLPFQPLLSAQKPLGIVAVGMAEFWSDEELSGALTNLHAWVAPGSQLLLTHQTPGEGADALALFYQGQGRTFRARSADRVAELLWRWKVAPGKITSLGGDAALLGLVASP